VTRRVFAAYGQPDLDPNMLASARHEIHDQFVDLSKAQPVLDWRCDTGSRRASPARSLGIGSKLRLPIIASVS
jgi:hypothetical protein